MICGTPIGGRSNLARGTTLNWLASAYEVKEEEEIITFSRALVIETMAKFEEGSDLARAGGAGPASGRESSRCCCTVQESTCLDGGSCTVAVCAHPTGQKIVRSPLRMPWALARTLQYLITDSWGCDTHVSFFKPDNGGVLRAEASSEQPAPAAFELDRSVPLLHLVGGAISATRAAIANNNASDADSSNYNEERRPQQYIGHPITWGAGNETKNLPVGEMFVTVYTPSSDFSVESDVFRSVVYCFAEYAQQKLSGTDPQVPWHATLRPVCSYDQLVSDILQRLTSFELKDPSLRDYFICFVASPPEESSRGWSAVRGLAKDWALRRSYPNPLYELRTKRGSSYAAWVAWMPEIDNDWWKEYRELGPEIVGPFEIFEPVDKGSRTESKIAGTIAQFNYTWKHSALAEAIRIHDVHTILQYTSRHFDNVAANVLELNKARTLFSVKSYSEARKYATGLAERTGPICGVAFNDASRLSLLCGDPYRAIEFAGQRCKFAPWDLTGHANFIFANFATGDLNAIHDHLLNGLEGHRCYYCIAHLEWDGSLGDDRPNALLVVALAMYAMVNSDTSTRKLWAAEVIREGIRRKSPHLIHLADMVSTSVVKALLGTSGDDMGAKLLDFEKLEEIVQATAPELWEEAEALERILVASGGACEVARTLSTVPHQLPLPLALPAPEVDSDVRDMVG